MFSRTPNAASTLERRTVRSIHYNISYLVQGAEHGTDGAIVLLHDFPAGAFAWEDVISRLGGLERAVYAIDMLGFGHSDHPWPADTSVWGQADVLLYSLQQLNLTNIVLVGLGLGGGVAQILTTRLYRDQIAALVLINTICYQQAFADNWPLPDMKKRQDVEAPKQISLEDTIRDLRATLPNAVQNESRFKDVIDDYVTQWDSEVGKEVLYQHIRQLNSRDVNSVASDLHSVNKPMLIIWGAQNEIVPLKYADRLHREIKGSQLVTVPGAGHMILFDAPGNVADAITHFVSEL